MPAATTVLCPASPHPQSAAQFPDLSGPQSRLPRLCTLSVHHFLSVTIKCTSDLPRLIGDLIRPDTGHPPTYEPDTPRAAQTMTAVRGREAISMFIVQAEEAFAPRLVPGRDGDSSWGKDTKVSHRGHAYCRVTGCLPGIQTYLGVLYFFG